MRVGRVYSRRQASLVASDRAIGSHGNMDTFRRADRGSFDLCLFIGRLRVRMVFVE